MRNLSFVAVAVTGMVLLAGSAQALSPPPSGVAVVRGNEWFLRKLPSTGQADVTFRYGRVGDAVLLGDWDGDGTKTPAVVRGNIWYLRNSNSAGTADLVFSYGSAGDQPVAGDWDGDRTDTPGMVQHISRCVVDGGAPSCQPAATRWWLRNSNSAGNADQVVTFCCPGSPVVGDWGGGRHDRPGVVNGNRWLLDKNLDSAAETAFHYGSRGDIPVVGDWNGDGLEDPGVVRGNQWLVRYFTTTGTANTSFSYGRVGDTFLTW